MTEEEKKLKMLAGKNVLDNLDTMYDRFEDIQVLIDAEYQRLKQEQENK